MDPGTEEISKLLVIFTAGPLAISFFLFTTLAGLLHFARKRRQLTDIPLYNSTALHQKGGNGTEYTTMRGGGVNGVNAIASGIGGVGGGVGVGVGAYPMVTKRPSMDHIRMMPHTIGR